MNAPPTRPRLAWLTFPRRLLAFAILMALAAMSGNWWFQFTLAFLLISSILIVYRIFLHDLLRYLIEHVGQASILVLLLGMLYGKLGVSYGIPEVFWSEYIGPRIFSAIGVTLLLAMLGINSHYIDLDRERTRRMTEDFLKARFWVKDRWIRDRFPTLERKARWLFDEDPLPDLEQFLRVRRFPFLMLASMPALFPALFPYIPPIAPGERVLEIDQNWIRNLLIWLFGLVIWGIGLTVGVVMIRILVRVSTAAEHSTRDFAKGLWWIAWLMVGLGLAFHLVDAGAVYQGKELISSSDDVIGTLSLSLQIAGLLFYCGMVLELIRRASEQKDHTALGAVLTGLLYLSVPAAVALTVLDAARVFPGLNGSTAWNWTLFGVDLFALMMILVQVCRWTADLHPGPWPISLWARFFKYLFMVYATLGGLTIVNLWVHLLPKNFQGLSTGMSVCILLAVFSLLLSWSFMLGRRSELVGGKIHWPAEETDPTRRVRIALPLGIALVLWIGLVNNAEYKLHFPELDYNELVPLKSRIKEVYGDLEKLNVPRADQAPLQAGLIEQRAALKAWYDRACCEQCTSKPKLVVVCASGGASRAAFWTAVVLDRLGQELTGFDQSVRMITGASGGMVGASYYVSQLYEKQNGAERPSWLDQIDTNPLPGLANHIALKELPMLMLPRPPWKHEDRGTVLENEFVWRPDRKPALNMPIRDLREFEATGRLPSLVFSPVIVDDGRRLLISNLDLGSMAVNRGDELVGDSHPLPETASQRDVVSSLAAIEFFKCFQTANGDALKLGTAARMSASFPFVSPAVNLPCDPPLRLVDAGYYDNFGVNLAAIWIGEHWKYLQELGVSGIVMVQVRAFLGRAERISPPLGTESAFDLSRGFELIGSPIKAFGSGRFTGSVFRNDSELSALLEYVNMNARQKDFLTTIILENSSVVQTASSGDLGFWPGERPRGENQDGTNVNTEVAMTWYVTESERSAMTLAIPKLELARSTFPKDCDDPDKFFWKRLEKIKEMAHEVKRTELGPRRDFYAKELERALNFERIEALKAWWKKKQS